MLLETAVETLMRALINKLPHDFTLESCGIVSVVPFRNQFAKDEVYESDEGEMEVNFEIYGTEWLKENEEGYIYQLHTRTWDTEIIEGEGGEHYVGINRVRVKSFLTEIDGKEERLFYVEPNDYTSIGFPHKELVKIKVETNDIDKFISGKLTLRDYLSNDRLEGRVQSYTSAFSTTSETLFFGIEDIIKKLSRCDEVIVIERDGRNYVFDEKTKDFKISLPMGFISFKTERIEELVKLFEENGYEFAHFEDYLGKDFRKMLGEELFVAKEEREGSKWKLDVKPKVSTTPFVGLNVVQTESSVNVIVSYANEEYVKINNLEMTSAKYLGYRTETRRQKALAVSGGFGNLASRIKGIVQREVMAKMLESEIVINELKEQFASACEIDVKDVGLNIDHRQNVLVLHDRSSALESLVVNVTPRILTSYELEEDKLCENLRFDVEMKGGFSDLYSGPISRIYLSLKDKSFFKFLRETALFLESGRKHVLREFVTDKLEAVFIGQDFILKTNYEVFKQTRSAKRLIFRRTFAGLLVSLAEGADLIFTTFIRVPVSNFDYRLNIIEPLFRVFNENALEHLKLRWVIGSKCLELIEEMEEKLKVETEELPF